MQQVDNRTGIWLMIATAFVFSMQDGVSRHLAGDYNTFMVVMIRYWFFAAFVVLLTLRQAGGIARVARTEQIWIHVLRGTFLAAEICITVIGFVRLGLVNTHAIFTCYPLLVAAFSGPLLGERVGWRRWTAITLGFAGILIILRPGTAVFTFDAIYPLSGALMFAIYSLLTRYAARRDSSATNFFWTGIIGAIFMTAVGIWFWQPMIAADWGWMALLCVMAACGHWLLIRCYAVAEASAVQPFAFFQLPFVSIIGITLFGEEIRANVVIGAAIVVGASLFTLWRERRARAA